MTEKEELDRIRCLIDMHLNGEDRKEKLAIQADRSAGLAEHYKKEGYLKDAVSEMRRSLSLTKDENYESMLLEWEKEVGIIEIKCPYDCGQRFSNRSTDRCPSCNRLVKTCSSCNVSNRCLDPYCRVCGKALSRAYNDNHRPGNFSKSWFHSMAIDHVCASPVTVGDVIVLPMLNDGGLLALKAFNGEIAWKLNNLGIDRNTKLMFSYPYLYLYSARMVQRIMMGLDTMTPEIIYSAPDIHTDHPTFPLLDGKIIYFPVRNGLFIHNIFRKSGSLMELNVDGSSRFSVVKSGKEVFAFSQKGKIYRVISDSVKLYHSLDSFDMISPPISPAKGNWIYFEGYKDGKRMINAWSHEYKTTISGCIPDEFCSYEDSHFHSPPLLYKDGALVISSQEPAIYYAKCFGNNIDLKEMRIDISAGIKKVMNIEFMFSLIVDSFFISRISDGFFYVNLDEKTEGGIEFFGSELMSRPLIFNNQLLLICKDGVRCYAF